MAVSRSEQSSARRCVELGFPEYTQTTIDEVKQIEAEQYYLQLLVFAGFDHQVHSADTAGKKEYSLVQSCAIDAQELTLEQIDIQGKQLIAQARENNTFRAHFRLELQPVTLR